MSTEAEHVPVVILGAGPTGVTVATLLAKYGIESLLLERWSEIYPQPRAVHLDDEIYRVLARLGVADEFAAVTRPALGLRLVDRSMTTLCEFRRDNALSSNGFPQANMFDQPELERLLRHNLARHPQARLRGGVDVTDVVDEGERVRISYSDRTDGAERVLYADYALGCDGANSLTRNAIGSRMQELGFEQRWLVVDVATAADLHQWEGVHQVCDPVRAGTYMRIGETRYRWEFQLAGGETAADFETIDTLRPLIHPWVSHVDPAELELVRVTEYTFRAQLADTWRRGRIFLLGDAAHLTPPFIGQGMGAGMRDAMNLAWKLAGVLTGALDPSALDTYATERKPHARSLIRLALGVGQAMTSGGRLGSVIRRVVLPQLHRVPGLSAKVLDGRTPGLRRSALNARSRIPFGLAGTLCPNPVVGGGGKRLDAELGDAFAVITSSTPGAAERALIARRGATLHVAEAGTELSDWLRRGHATAAIVRPDRTVMKTGRNVATLCSGLPESRCAPANRTIAGTRPEA